MFSINRLIKSFHYARHGLAIAFREEQNFRVQSGAALLAMALGAWLDIDAVEWALMVFVIGLVLLMELANSAVERIADVLKPRLDDYVKEIKDIAAAAVLLASLIAVAVGLIIFWPKIFQFFGA